MPEGKEQLREMRGEVTEGKEEILKRLERITSSANILHYLTKENDPEKLSETLEQIERDVKELKELVSKEKASLELAGEEIKRRECLESIKDIFESAYNSLDKFGRWYYKEKQSKEEKEDAIDYIKQIKKEAKEAKVDIEKEVIESMAGPVGAEIEGKTIKEALDSYRKKVKKIFSGAA